MARPRWATRRYWLTSTRSTRPLLTITQPRSEAGRDAATQQEPQERQRESEADEPPPETVQPFPEEDRLEVGEGHPGMDEAELRDFAVAGEFRLPGGIAERRQN